MKLRLLLGLVWAYAFLLVAAQAWFMRGTLSSALPGLLLAGGAVALGAWSLRWPPRAVRAAAHGLVALHFLPLVLALGGVTAPTWDGVLLAAGALVLLRNA